MLITGTLLSGNIQAQTLIKNANNTVVAYYDNSIVYDLNSTAILDCTNAGEIKSFGGDVAATFSTSTGQLKDATNTLLYTIEGNNVKDESNTVVATIDTDGNLKDINGDVIGYGNGISKYHLVYFFMVYLTI